MEVIKISKIVISKTGRFCAYKSLIYLNLYKGKWVLARKFILNVSFSSQNISSFMSLKTLQIHCYYQISQEQNSSTVTFRAMIWNGIAGYGWRKMVTLGEVISLATPRGAIMVKVSLLRVFRLLEKAIAAIVYLKMLSDIEAHNKLQPQSLLISHFYT